MASTHQILIAGISVDVQRKDIKNLHLGVYPPAGRVRVASPLLLGDEAIRLAVISRLGWIRRQQAAFSRQARESKREFITGESHYFRGRRYRLEVVEHTAPPAVEWRNKTVLTMRVPRGTSTSDRADLLDAWYRVEMRRQMPELLEKWLPRVGVSRASVRIRKMKTLWGSCSVDAARLWLNLELIKKPVACLEYILVHELTHLLERHHSDRFIQLMDSAMPMWRQHRSELNNGPLTHEDWTY